MADKTYDRDLASNEDERPVDPDAESLFDQGGDSSVRDDEDRPVPDDISDYVIDEPDDEA